MSTCTIISEDEIRTFERDGAICLRQIFSPQWVAKVTTGINTNLANPSSYGEFLRGPDGHGVYFNDYCNWRRIPEFEQYVTQSPVASVAGQLMRSSKSIFYHEHVLVKETGTDKRTPWHVDLSYYPVDAKQCLSVWMPVDRVEIPSTLKFVAGSHRWREWFMPRKFATSLNYLTEYDGDDGKQWKSVLSDEDIERKPILGWRLDPGDCVVFHMQTIHGAAGNSGEAPRRILSTRWLGDDAVMVNRPWEVSPPPVDGKVLDGQSASDYGFPTLWVREAVR